MRVKAKATLAEKADRHELYQRSVQAADAECDFVAETFASLRGRQARSLREDFCGTALVSCEWVGRHRANTAIGVDIDPSVLEWGRAHNVAGLARGAQARVELRNADVMTVAAGRVDVVLAMNFSYWVFKERATLRRYFERVRAGLKPDGVFFLDAFGGYDAFRVLRERTAYPRFTYVWHQASYDPVTGDMSCYIDFKFPDGSQLKHAFEYHWRLWTLPELRELLVEAGFKRPTAYWQGTDPKTGEPNGEFLPTATGEPDAGWIAYLTAER